MQRCTVFLGDTKRHSCIEAALLVQQHACAARPRTCHLPLVLIIVPVLLPIAAGQPELQQVLQKRGKKRVKMKTKRLQVQALPIWAAPGQHRSHYCQASHEANLHPNSSKLLHPSCHAAR